MNFKRFFIALAVASAALVSCESKVDFGDPRIEINPSSLAFAKDVTSQDITLVSTRSWKAVEFPDWVAVSPAKGEASLDEQKVTITLLPNTGKDRTTAITFTCGLEKAYLTIEQAGEGGAVVAGDGSLEKPFSASEAHAYTAALAADSETSQFFYVSGKIHKLHSKNTDGITNYGNASFYISDDGQASDNDFLCFQVMYYGGAKFTSVDQIKVGDEVVVYAKFVNYGGNTPETVGKGSGKIYSINGVTGGGSDDNTGEAVSAEGLVVAASSQAYVLQTSTGLQYVFAKADPGVKVGDNVKVTGTSEVYANLPQISNPTTTVVSSNNAVSYPTPTVLDGAALDAYPATPGLGYIKVTGDLVVSGNYYNLTVPGATTNKGSLAYPIDAKKYEGKTIDVTGYFVGITGSIYVNIIVTDITVSEHQTEVEKLTHPLASTVTWTLGTAAYDNTSSGNSKQSAKINGETVDNLLKLGKSTAGGDATLTVPEGVTKIGFYAAGWVLTQSEITAGAAADSKVELTVGDKTVQVARVAGATGNPPYTMTFSDSANYYEVAVTPGSVKVSTPSGSGNRIAIIGITAY